MSGESLPFVRHLFSLSVSSITHPTHCTTSSHFIHTASPFLSDASTVKSSWTFDDSFSVLPQTLFQRTVSLLVHVFGLLLCPTLVGSLSFLGSNWSLLIPYPLTRLPSPRPPSATLRYQFVSRSLSKLVGYRLNVKLTKGNWYIIVSWFPPFPSHLFVQSQKKKKQN